MSAVIWVGFCGSTLSAKEGMPLFNLPLVLSDLSFGKPSLPTSLNAPMPRLGDTCPLCSSVSCAHFYHSTSHSVLWLVVLLSIFAIWSEASPWRDMSQRSLDPHGLGCGSAQCVLNWIFIRDLRRCLQGFLCYYFNWLQEKSREVGTGCACGSPCVF